MAISKEELQRQNFIAEMVTLKMEIRKTKGVSMENKNLAGMLIDGLILNARRKAKEQKDFLKSIK